MYNSYNIYINLIKTAHHRKKIFKNFCWGLFFSNFCWGYILFKLLLGLNITYVGVIHIIAYPGLYYNLTVQKIK